ncbi:MAG: Ig-like domain-containing protein [Prevotellaceae bacterium]|jgi:uncharacterized protein (TIGR02145 family)|nr:Ig-like domain-containing protein [Prevotellaceae bacterium]
MFKKIKIFLGVICLTLTVTSCEKITGILFETPSTYLAVGEEYALDITISPKSATGKGIVWSSSDNSKVSVSNKGVVKGLAVGTSIITARIKDYTATCTITVYELSTSDDGVEIDGVVWATRNIDAPNTFAAKPESAGKFYQFNKNVAWSSTDPLTASNGAVVWDNVIINFNTWQAENEVSPDGWRVPSLDQIKSLLGTPHRLTKINGIFGQMFGNENKTIFLPAVGFRYETDGTLYYSGEAGGYWANERSGTSAACYLYFGSNETDWYYRTQTNGYSVRSVKK